MPHRTELPLQSREVVYLPWGPSARLKKIEVGPEPVYNWFHKLTECLKYVYEYADLELRVYYGVYRYRMGDKYCHLIWEIPEGRNHETK